MHAVVNQSHDGMKAREPMDDEAYFEWCGVGQGLRHVCDLAQLLFNLFFAAMLKLALKHFHNDEDVSADMVKVKSRVQRTVTKRKGKKGENVELVEIVKSIRGMRYADDAGVLSKSLTSLHKMMPITVKMAGRLMLLVSERKTEIMCLFVTAMGACSLTINAAGAVFNQIERFLYLGVTICEDQSVEDEINHEVERAPTCFRRNS